MILKTYFLTWNFWTLFFNKLKEKNAEILGAERSEARIHFLLLFVPKIYQNVHWKLFSAAEMLGFSLGSISEILGKNFKIWVFAQILLPPPPKKNNLHSAIRDIPIHVTPTKFWVSTSTRSTPPPPPP